MKYWAVVGWGWAILYLDKKEESKKESTGEIDTEKKRGIEDETDKQKDKSDLNPAEIQGKKSDSSSQQIWQKTY